MNFTKIIIVFLILIYAFSIPVFAWDWDESYDFTDAGEMGSYITDHILIHTTNTLYDYDTVSNTYEAIIYDLPTYHDTFYYNGDIYISLATGTLIRFTGSKGESYTGNPESFESLHTVTYTGGKHIIVIDALGYIYMTGGDSVYRFDPNDNFNDSHYVYIPDVQYDVVDNACSLSLHPDGLIIGQNGWYGGTKLTNVFLYDGISLISIANESHYYGDDMNRYISQVIVSESGNIFFSYTVAGSGSWTLYYNETSNTSATIYSDLSTGFYLNSSGYLYSSHPANNKVVIYYPIEDEGGYDPFITTLLEFTNEPIEVNTYAHLECNLNDYWNTKADEHYYLSYDYYYKNISDYTIIDYNELELTAKNTVTFIPTYYPYFNQTGGCEIKASVLYTYRDPVYHEVQLGGFGYYVSTVLVNSTYEPPEEPEESEEPEIPDPEPDPEPEPDPPIPPIQPNETGANQSINVSWTGEYYNTVNTTVDGLCSPIYNFTNWSLSPIYSLNDSVGEFNYYMNESFTQTAQDSSILYESINTIFGAIHPKIRNVITYYLIWVVLLIVLKKD